MRKTIIRQRAFPMIFPDPPVSFPLRIVTVGYHRTGLGQRFYRVSDLDRYFCGFTLQGRSTLILPGEDAFTVTAGDTYLMHKGESYEVRFEPHPLPTAIYVSVEGPLFEALLDAYALRDVHRVSRMNCRAQIETILRLAREGDPELHARAAVLVHGILQAMSAKAHRLDVRRYSPDVRVLKAHIDNHTEDAIPMRALSAMVRKSPAQIIRMFRKEVGAPPHRYHLNKKIELSRHLLADRGMRVKEVAACLGFADPYYFSGLFRQKTGLSPSHYRRGAPASRR
ncbi:MAG: AraC family transcriptional regulator [Kiritimatiellae bacterium]|nr:AraC family transcriptional regulator [Kiritimatiellia bacterium]